MQCLVEEAEATPNTLTAALQLIALFSRGCHSKDDWQTLCRGPYGDELLHQMWFLYEPMQWSLKTDFLGSYGRFVLYRQPPGYWLSTEGQHELQRRLTSQIKEEIAQGLFACAGIIWDTFNKQYDEKLVPLDKVESLLFHDAPTIWTAASFAFAVFLSFQKQKLQPSSKTLDRLLWLWLSIHGDRSLEPLSVVFCRRFGFPRQTWEPILSDAQVQRIHQLAESKLEGVDSNYLFGACIVVAFHAKNVWGEDELASRLAKLKDKENGRIFFARHGDRNLSIDNMLKQMGEAGRKYITSEKPPRRNKKT